LNPAARWSSLVLYLFSTPRVKEARWRPLLAANAINQRTPMLSLWLRPQDRAGVAQSTGQPDPRTATSNQYPNGFLAANGYLYVSQGGSPDAKPNQ
jgi:hypothetical protein